MDEGDVHFGPPSSLVNQTIFNDLIVAQVKVSWPLVLSSYSFVCRRDQS